MKNDEFKEKMKFLLKSKKISQKQIAADLSMTPGQVSNIISGRDKLGLQKAQAIGEYLAVDPLWLMTQGEQGTPPGDDEAAITAQPREDIIMVPVINLDVRGGLLANAVTDTAQYTVDAMPFSRSIASEGDVVAPVYGDSMAPRYPSGSHILIRPLPMWREWLELGQSYVLELNDWRRTIKIVRKGTSEDTYRLECYNVDYDTTEIPKAIIAHVWQVLACVKREVM